MTFVSKPKSRQLPLQEYYSILQKEWLVSHLRWMIYTGERDKNYYKEREMNGKRKIIEDLSLRNNLVSIFTSSERMDYYKNMIYNETGLPNFIYRSDEDRSVRRKRDILSYFSKGCKVEIVSEGEDILMGVIDYTFLDKNTCNVLIQGDIIELPFSKIRRVFCDSLWE